MKHKMEDRVVALESSIGEILSILKGSKAVEPISIQSPKVVPTSTEVAPKVLSASQFSDMLKWQTIKAKRYATTDKVERALWYVFSPKANRDYLLIKKAGTNLPNGTLVRTIRQDGSVKDHVKGLVAAA